MHTVTNPQAPGRSVTERTLHPRLRQTSGALPGLSRAARRIAVHRGWWTIRAPSDPPAPPSNRCRHPPTADPAAAPMPSPQCPPSTSRPAPAAPRHNPPHHPAPVSCSTNPGRSEPFCDSLSAPRLRQTAGARASRFVTPCTLNSSAPRAADDAGVPPTRRPRIPTGSGTRPLSGATLRPCPFLQGPSSTPRSAPAAPRQNPPQHRAPVTRSPTQRVPRRSCDRLWSVRSVPDLRGACGFVTVCMVAPGSRAGGGSRTTGSVSPRAAARAA